VLSGELHESNSILQEFLDLSHVKYLVAFIQELTAPQ
jgi:hypothetical protein